MEIELLSGRCTIWQIYSESCRSFSLSILPPSISDENVLALGLQVSFPKV